MRPSIKITLALVVLLCAATAAVAMADPIAPTTPYPAPAADAPACEAKRLAVREAKIDHDFAEKMYVLEKQVFDGGAGTLAALWAAERELHLASIALNEAKYAEATCRNDKGNAADKVCVGLALRLNKLLDELPSRVALEDLAKKDHKRVGEGAGSGVEDKRSLAAAERTALKAEATRQRIEQEIKDLREAIKNNPACANFNAERPRAVPPAPPAPPVPPVPPVPPAPTSAVPTGVPSGPGTSTDAPVPSSTAGATGAH